MEKHSIYHVGFVWSMYRSIFINFSTLIQPGFCTRISCLSTCSPELKRAFCTCVLQLFESSSKFLYQQSITELLTWKLMHVGMIIFFFFYANKLSRRTIGTAESQHLLISNAHQISYALSFAARFWFRKWLMCTPFQGPIFMKKKKSTQ